MNFEFPEVDLSGASKSMKELDNTLQKITEDIAKLKDKTMAMEFARVICDLLKENGVTVQMAETQEENHATNKFEVKYGVRFTGIDFSEHDKKVTEEKDKEIERLKNQIEKLNHEKMILRTRCKSGIEKDFDKGLFGKLAIVGCNEEFTDIQNKRISELEDRHQSDCIEINRLNVALEVMTEKYMKFREVHGL